MTKLAPLLGFPLGYSLSPPIYAAAFAALEIDARCDAWITPVEDLKAVTARLRAEAFLGACVTVPHKETIIPFLDDFAPDARRIGAVNCVVSRNGSLTGHNTDLYGFMRSLAEAGFTPAAADVLLLGAGGAARAVVIGLVDAGAERLTLSGRSAERATEAAKALTAASGKAIRYLAFDDSQFAAGCQSADLIVNCTPIGTKSTAEALRTPIPSSLLPMSACVFDLVYNPAETVLLREARARGARTIAGLDMLVYQAAENLRLWTGREAPVDIMKEAAERALSTSG